jgi:putative ABC transport system permease protein
MLKNLFKTASRHILKHSGYSLLNILGLTLGISSALFLIIYVADEASYDRYHKNADRIYRVSSTITEPDDQFTWVVAQIPFGPQVAQDYPEVQAFARFINMQRALYKYEDKEFNEDGFFYADSTVFDIFSYKVIKGDVKKALTEPNRIILTERIAAKYFGKTDPIGKELKSEERSYEVTAIIKDIPHNSHFRFDALAARNNLPKQLGSWGNFGVFTYLMFAENFDIKPFETKMQDMYGRYMQPLFGPLNIKIKYNLEPITKIHLYSTNAGEPEPTGSIAYIYIFAIVAVFLIFIAAMNYMNLSTARSSRRAREVGMRKVAGSQRGPLVMQFLAESVIFTLVSLVLSLAVFSALLPKFNLLAGKAFDLHILYSPVMLLALIGIIIFVGILGGSYPSFFLSRFSPLTVLKGEITQGAAGSTFRKILVVLQFTVSVSMIICTMVVFSQLNYLKTMDQGFDQKNVIALQLNGPMASKYRVLKQLLLEDPAIKSIGVTDTPIGQGSGKVIFNVETDQGMSKRGVNFAVVDNDFVKTLGITIKSGRNFQEDMPSDTIRSVLVNETFVKRMNWTEPLGKKVSLFGDSTQLQGRVIGVMKDYHQTGMYNQIESLLLLYRISNRQVYVKIDDKESKQALAFIEKKWHEVFPDQPFVYEYLSHRFNMQFEADEKRGFIFTLFTVLAILIACLGLFGLASYTVEQRTREVGIRKVFGAADMTIIGLISKDFLILIGISILISFPVSWYIMNKWLAQYVYKYQIGPWLFILSAFLTCLITFITISFKAYQASVMNPAQSVRRQ